MNLCSNELWVVQEINPFTIPLEARNRKGKLIFVYDLVSRFILHTQFYFLSDAGNYNMDVFSALWKYGIPNYLLFPEADCKNQVFNGFVNMLGIQCIVRDKKQTREYMLERFHEDESGMVHMEKKWRESLQWLGEMKYRDFNEFQKNMERAVMRWNYSMQKDTALYTPAQRFQLDVRQHVFLDKQTLAECCITRYKGMVTKDGTVQMLHRVYRVPEEFEGEMIQFYGSAMQKDEIYIFDESRKRLLYRCPFLKLLE